MPVYEYVCAPCGAFEAERPLAEYAAAQPCPSCGAAAPRAIVTPPRVGSASTALRRAHARNERAAEAPQRGRVSGAAETRTRGSAIHRHGRPPRAGGRPWMLSH